MPCIRIPGGIVCTRTPREKMCVGSLPPSGYLDWHEWAEIQYKGGLRQSACPSCGRWLFPQERKVHECGDNP